MMSRVILCICVVITGCKSVPITITSCNRGIPQISSPKAPRTVEEIAEAYNRAKYAGQVTYRDLQQCSAKVDQLLHFLNEQSHI